MPCTRRACARRRSPATSELTGILTEELGARPTEELRALHDAIATGSVRAPANSLPADKVDFTGRTRERTQLIDVASAPVRVIDGMPGIGKTTLAVHVAHELRGDYPDAALFIDLHGHSDRYPPMATADALDSLLRMLGVPGERIPAALDDRAARWRAELAGRKALLVLDNAADAAQVRPLLPGSPDCLVLITSRRRLAALDGAQPLSLDVLPPADALALFTGMVGASARMPRRMRPPNCCAVADICRWPSGSWAPGCGPGRPGPLWTCSRSSGASAN